MKKLKERWGIVSNTQLIIIFIVFGITGSVSAKIAGPAMDIMGWYQETMNPWIYWPVRILLIFPIYQVLLIFFGWLFGQFTFFWNFEKKMLSRMGLAFLFNNK